MKKDKKNDAQEEVADLTALQDENRGLFEQLTHKNEDYMVKLNKRLEDADFSDDRRTVLFNDMLKTLVSEQSAGRTARQIYGTVTERYLEMVDGPRPDTKETTGERSEDWKLYVDGGLMLGGMFALVTGLSALFSKSGTASGMGILTLILNFIIGGFVVLAITKNAPIKGQKGSTLRYFLVSVVGMLIWVAVMTLSMLFIPPVINPILPPIANVVIGILAFAGKWYFKRKFNVKGTLF